MQGGQIGVERGESARQESWILGSAFEDRRLEIPIQQIFVSTGYHAFAKGESAIDARIDDKNAVAGGLAGLAADVVDINEGRFEIGHGDRVENQNIGAGGSLIQHHIDGERSTVALELARNGKLIAGLTVGQVDVPTVGENFQILKTALRTRRRYGCETQDPVVHKAVGAASEIRLRRTLKVDRLYSFAAPRRRPIGC